MKKLFLIIAVLLVAQLARSKGLGSTAVGLRGGTTTGISVRFYSDDENSFRFLFSTRERGIQLTALREFHRHKLFEFVPDLIVVYGAGVHGGYEQEKEYQEGSTVIYSNNTAPVFGVDGLIGLEYSIWQTPVSIGLEAKPFFDVWGYKGFRVHPLDLGLTIRFHF